MAGRRLPDDAANTVMGKWALGRGRGEGNDAAVPALRCRRRDSDPMLCEEAKRCGEGNAVEPSVMLWFRGRVPSPVLRFFDAE